MMHATNHCPPGKMLHLHLANPTRIMFLPTAPLVQPPRAKHPLFPHKWAELRCLKEEVGAPSHPTERRILRLPVW